MDVNGLLAAISREIINPIIYLLFAVAVVIFLWGGFVFVANAEDESARTEGKRKLIWGIVGMLIMLLAIFIVQVVANSIGAPVPAL